MKTDKRPTPTPHVWVTRDGQAIPVRLMSDRHLMNALRWLVRNAARIKRATVDRLTELQCTLDELTGGDGIELHDLLDGVQTTADDPAILAALSGCTSIADIGDLADCVELMNGDEVLRATVVTFPAMVLEARRRGLLGRPTRELATGVPQITGETGGLQRIETRVEPTRKGWTE